MYEKVLAMIAAYRAGDWLTAAKLALEVIRGLLDVYPLPAPMPPNFHALPTDDLIANLQTEIGPAPQPGVMKAVPWSTLLPLLIEILLRLLGKPSP